MQDIFTNLIPQEVNLSLGPSSPPLYTLTISASSLAKCIVLVIGTQHSRQNKPASVTIITHKEWETGHSITTYSPFSQTETKQNKASLAVIVTVIIIIIILLSIMA